MHLELVPTHGLNIARFGVTPAELRTVMPEAECYQEWMGGNLNDSLLYRGLILGFDSCDARGPLPDAKFVEVRTYVPRRGELLLWGTPLAQWQRTALRAALLSKGGSLEVDTPESLNSASLAVALDFASDGRLEYIEAWRAR